MLHQMYYVLTSYVEKYYFRINFVFILEHLFHFSFFFSWNVCLSDTQLIFYERTYALVTLW
jgi:hypothetical protein